MAANPTQEIEQKLRRQYGMTLADYNKMLADQEGKCLICREYRKLVVDHCHDSKKVRGLLCSHCNTALGLLEERIPSFQNAIAYLNTHNKE